MCLGCIGNDLIKTLLLINESPCVMQVLNRGSDIVHCARDNTVVFISKHTLMRILQFIVDIGYKYMMYLVIDYLW